MRKTPRLVLAALAAVVALSLGGCVPQDSNVKPAPAPSATPAFASDDAALAAATKAYGEYLRVTDDIFRDGGASADREHSVATGKQLKDDLAGFAQAVHDGVRSSGSTIFENARLQQYEPAEKAGKDIVVVYLCEDSSALKLVDADGVQVLDPDRPVRAVYQVSFDADPINSKHLLVSDRQPWSGEPC